MLRPALTCAVSPQDGESIEVLLRQDMPLGGPRRPDTPGPDPSLPDPPLSGPFCSPEPPGEEEDSLGPRKPEQQVVSSAAPSELEARNTGLPEHGYLGTPDPGMTSDAHRARVFRRNCCALLRSS